MDFIDERFVEEVVDVVLFVVIDYGDIVFYFFRVVRFVTVLVGVVSGIGVRLSVFYGNYKYLNYYIEMYLN